MGAELKRVKEREQRRGSGGGRRLVRKGKTANLGCKPAWEAGFFLHVLFCLGCKPAVGTP